MLEQLSDSELMKWVRENCNECQFSKMCDDEFGNDRLDLINKCRNGCLTWDY